MSRSVQFQTAMHGTGRCRRWGSDVRMRVPQTKSGESCGDAAVFKQCLKLLGIQLDQAPGSRANSSPTSAGSRNVRRATPTMCTRVMKRTVSLSEICNSAGQPKEQVSRDVIAKAIYEEWYFQKLRNAQQLRVSKDIAEAEKQENLQKEAISKQQKAQENFVKWKRSKTKIQEDSKQQIILKGNPRPTRVTDMEGKSTEAFQLWKKEKDKLLQRRKLDMQDMCKKEEEKKKQDKEKKADAQAAFEAWKKRADQALKLKAQKENQIKNKNELQKQRQLEEQRENSGCSFNSWKNLKSEQMKKKMAQERLVIERQSAAKAAEQQARLYECDLAFEEWLNRVEARESCSERRNSRHVAVPWIPC